MQAAADGGAEATGRKQTDQGEAHQTDQENLAAFSVRLLYLCCSTSSIMHKKTQVVGDFHS